MSLGRSRKAVATVARKRLGEILVEEGLLTADGLQSALQQQQRWGGPLGKILLEMQLVEEAALVSALSRQLNFQIAPLEGKTIDKAVLNLVPVKTCKQHGIIPFRREGKFLDLAMVDPTDLGVIDELRIRTRLNVRPYLSGPTQVEKAIVNHYDRMSFVGGSGAPEEGELIHNNQSLGRKPVAEPQAVAAAFQMNGALTDLTRRRAAEKSAKNGAPQQAPAPAALPASAPAPAKAAPATNELAALTARLEELEAVIARDEDVIRKLMGILIQKGICTREELISRIQK